MKTKTPIDYTIMFMGWAIGWRLQLQYLDYMPFMLISRRGDGSQGI